MLPCSKATLPQCTTGEQGYTVLSTVLSSATAPQDTGLVLYERVISSQKENKLLERLSEPKVRHSEIQGPLKPCSYLRALQRRYVGSCSPFLAP
jgi:hypothetical protein